MEVKMLNSTFRLAVKDAILDFNKTREEQEILTIKVVENLPEPYKRFGKILEINELVPDSDVPGIVLGAIPRMAGAVIRALLRIGITSGAISVQVFKHNPSSKGFVFQLKTPDKNFSIA